MSSQEDRFRALVREVVEEVLAERGLDSMGTRMIPASAAAALASVSVDTILEWVATGRLRVAGKVGRRYRFLAADVRAAIATNDQRPRRRETSPTPEALADRALKTLRSVRGRRRA